VFLVEFFKKIKTLHEVCQKSLNKRLILIKLKSTQNDIEPKLSLFVGVKLP